jgi:hypothetical protein
MPTFARIIQQLRTQRDVARLHIERLDRAIMALREVAGGRPGLPPGRKPRMISLAGRRRIAAAQRARWAKLRAAKAGKG